MKANNRNWLRYILLTLGALAMLLPFVWMVSTSLKTTGQAVAMPPKWLPDPIMWENYPNALSVEPFDSYFINSVIVTALSTVGEILTSILAAYAFAKLNFYGKNVIFTLLMATMMVPFELLIIPNFITLANLDWINTYMALIVPWLASISSIFLLKQNFQITSDDYYNASKLDGSSDWTFLWRILVPMNRSSITTVVILKVISSWNSFLWPLMVTTDKSMRTLPVGLQGFTTQAGTRFEWLMAASTVVVIPMILIYIFFQKYIREGISQTGKKG